MCAKPWLASKLTNSLNRMFSFFILLLVPSIYSESRGEIKRADGRIVQKLFYYIDYKSLYDSIKFRIWKIQKYFREKSQTVRVLFPISSSTTSSSTAIFTAASTVISTKISTITSTSWTLILRLGKERTRLLLSNLSAAIQSGRRILLIESEE
jgi:hypothetical protein